VQRIGFLKMLKNSGAAFIAGSALRPVPGKQTREKLSWD
jgi:hypothetical protein